MSRWDDLGALNVSDPLWRLLLKDPSELGCDECLAVLEFFAGLLAEAGPELLPDVLGHLEGCPECPLELHQALRRLDAVCSEADC